ncbi:MAG: helix-hairpin-helix domain-containing protein [Planctomycetota bacterium]|nr:helix-hairpin-helix domain-containing protein [Planctomycetota bacterium]
MRGSSAIVDAGSGLWYEVLVPACDVERIGRRVGQDVVLHTIHYLEGDPAHGHVTPRLVGFLSESDRDFFRVFTTVKGIGARKALRALAKPVAEVAAAINAKDGRFLMALPEIGKRTAETIIAELHGKVDDFAGASGEAAAAAQMSEPAQEAVAVLVQLGERRRADHPARLQTQGRRRLSGPREDHLQRVRRGRGRTVQHGPPPADPRRLHRHGRSAGETEDFHRRRPRPQ